MNSPFPHAYFLASALVLAIGGLAMMAAIISGDHAAIDRLLDAYIAAFGTGVVSLIGFAVHHRIKGRLSCSAFLNILARPRTAWDAIAPDSLALTSPFGPQGFREHCLSTSDSRTAQTARQ
jgi:hypothetical protein